MGDRRRRLQQHYRLFKALEDRGRSHALAVPSSQRVIVKTTVSDLGKEHRADALIAALLATAWRTMSAGAGSKGPSAACTLHVLMYGSL